MHAASIEPVPYMQASFVLCVPSPPSFLVFNDKCMCSICSAHVHYSFYMIWPSDHTSKTGFLAEILEWVARLYSRIFWLGSQPNFLHCNKLLYRRLTSSTDRILLSRNLASAGYQEQRHCALSRQCGALVTNAQFCCQGFYDHCFIHLVHHLLD